MTYRPTPGYLCAILARNLNGDGRLDCTTSYRCSPADVTGDGLAAFQLPHAPTVIVLQLRRAYPHHSPIPLITPTCRCPA